MTPMPRRDLIRLALLGLAVAGGGGLLAACSDGSTSGGDTDPEPTSLGKIELVSSDAKRAAGDPALVPQVVEGLQSLAGGLYGGLATQQGNLVLSPYSVLVALGMTLAGARGGTATEMREVLGVGDLGARWHEGVNALTASIDGLAGKQKASDGSDAEIELATANQLFGQQDLAWEKPFLDLLAKEYGAALRAVDFAHASEQVRVLINDWVEQQTHDRIEDLVPPGVLDAMTRLVLVNAIYLKAPWAQPFEKSLTRKAGFHREDGTTVRVDMMTGAASSGTALVEGEGWRGARIPYAGRRLAMTVVLPDAGKLREVEATLAKSGFAAVARGRAAAAVNLTLPRWRFRTQAPLADLLAQLGMPTAFGNGADFSGMTAEEQLQIAAVLHQGFVAVDEDGTEAAAATAVAVGVTGALESEELVIDRPFLFVIHDVEHGTPIFVGRVSDPSVD